MPITSTATALEEWDERVGKWILYRTEEEHSDDCRRFPFKSMPCRIFLDTNVVNSLVKYSGQIFEQQTIPVDVPRSRALEVEALMHVMQVGARANWVVTTSPKALEEIGNTQDPALRGDLWDYARELLLTHNENYNHAQSLGRRSIGAPFLKRLTDPADRELIGNAIGLGCDTFCTSDIRTIVRFRELLIGVPIRILTPIEWWQHLKPWAGLFL